MVTKEDLIFLRDFGYLQRQRERELERIREAVYVHAVQYDRIMVGGGEERDRMAEHAVAVDELERKFNSETIVDKARYRAIAECILRLPPKEMEIIRLRYQEAHGWNWIRRKCHYSEREIYRIHKKALEDLEKM